MLMKIARWFLGCKEGPASRVPGVRHVTAGCVRCAAPRDAEGWRELLGFLAQRGSTNVRVLLLGTDAELGGSPCLPEGVDVTRCDLGPDPADSEVSDQELDEAPMPAQVNILVRWLWTTPEGASSVICCPGGGSRAILASALYLNQVLDWDQELAWRYLVAAGFDCRAAGLVRLFWETSADG